FFERDPDMGIWVLLAQAQSGRHWSDFFFSLGSGSQFVVVIVAIGCFTGIVTSLITAISSTISTAQLAKSDLELKRELLDRGMSAEEIARVVEATPADRLPSKKRKKA